MAAFGTLVHFFLATVFASAAFAQTAISLEQAQARQAPEFTPVWEGKQVRVRGVVPAEMVHVREYSHLVIQNANGHGLTIEGTEDLLGGIRPGDVLELDGVIFNRSGLPVLRPAEIRKIGSETPPAPRRITTTQANSMEFLGTYVEVESYVIAVGENAGGDNLLLGSAKEPSVRAFLPREPWARHNLQNLNPGDRVRVVGFGSQYCPNPPYDHSFQLMVRNPSAVTVLSKGWIVAPETFLTLLASIMFGLILWWFRERSVARQRTRLRILTALAEEVIACENAGDISRRLNAVLPQVLASNQADLYLLSATSDSLDRLPTADRPVPVSIPVQSPLGPFNAIIALCFRNRSLLQIPKVSRSPLMQSPIPEDLPKSALIVPMFAQRDVVGVLAILFDSRRRKLNADEQSAVQHLANQIATSFQLQQQATMHHQLLRSEKLAAAGQLISGVANELKTPLSIINRIANELLTERRAPSLENELSEIAFEAHSGSEIVSRLVSFANSDQPETKPLNIIVLLTSLMEFREREWIQKSVQVKDELLRLPLLVLGNRSQLEQAFLNLLVHAEQELATARVKNITIASRTEEHKLVLTIEYSAEDRARDPFHSDASQTLGLHVSRAIVESHGGEVAFMRRETASSAFVIALPLFEANQSLAPMSSTNKLPARQLTTLVVEPDAAALRKLMTGLSARGHRAVPVKNADEAAELAHRLKFDVAFCSIRLPGMNWADFFEKVRLEISSFVLVAEGYDSELTRAFKGSDGYVLTKPIDETEVQRLLAAIEERQETAPRR